jgi:hypothetical protein
VARNATNTQQVTYATVISLAQGGRDVTIQNRSLLPEHLTIIANQARAQSESTETEISFTAAGVPWLRRGQYITLTGLIDEIGYEVPLQRALVTEARIEYRESSANPTYLSYIKAIFWKDGP